MLKLKPKPARGERKEKTAGRRGVSCCLTRFVRAEQDCAMESKLRVAAKASLAAALEDLSKMKVK